MTPLLLRFLLPYTTAAASPFLFLGSVVAATLVAKTLTALTAMNGSFMALAPEKAGEKLYHLSKEDITPTVVQFVRNNGMSALSLATTQSLLAYANVKPSIAIAAGLIPRLIVLLNYYTGKVPNRLNLDGLVPIYIIQIACALCLVKDNWIESTVAMQIMSIFYTSAGLGLSIAPKPLSKLLLQMDDASEIEQRCLRGQGKTDLINGVLIWALSNGDDFPRAVGISCLAWLTAIIYSDFVVHAGTTRSDANVQVMIAGGAALILL